MLLSVEANEKLTKATITIIVKATIEVTTRNDQADCNRVPTATESCERR